MQRTHWAADPSRWAIIVGMLVLFVMLGVSRRGFHDGVLRHDALEYYAYLPALLVFQDASLEKPLADPNAGPNIWFKTTPDGHRVLKMYSGMALLWLPGFLIAQLINLLAGNPLQGYAQANSIAISLSTLLYLAIGVVFLRKWLLRYVPQWPAALAIITLLLGTNLYYYTTGEPGMSHATLFAGLATLLWLTERFYDGPTMWRAVGIGALVGLMGLVRPTHLLDGLLVLGFGVFSRTTLQERTAFWQMRWRWAALALVAAAIFWVPQLLYWKAATGHFWFGGYQDEGFFFDKPKLISGLFSYRKGLFIYSPVLLLALPGLILLWRKATPWRIVVPLYLFIAYYVVVSWWCWWYGGGFGMRAMIDYFAVMALPLALTFRELWTTWVPKLLLLCILTGCILLNQKQTGLYRVGVMHWDSMTSRAYWAMFPGAGPITDFPALFDAPDYEAAKRGDR